MTTWPSPGLSRTRAMADFRRPTPRLVLDCCSANFDVPLLVEGDGPGALGLMLVLRSPVDAQPPEHLPAQRVVLEHPANGVGQRPGGVQLLLLAQAPAVQAAGVSAVAGVDLVVQLVPGN